MSNKTTFARLMGQIGAEAERQQLEELRAAQRQVKMRSIRKTCLIILAVSTVGRAYANRAEIGQRLSRTISPPVAQFGADASEEVVSSGTSSGEDSSPIAQQNMGTDLKLIQAQAHQRDQPLLELNK